MMWWRVIVCTIGLCGGIGPVTFIPWLSMLSGQQRMDGFWMQDAGP